MTDSPIKFRYFKDPHHFSTFSEKDEKCGLCGNVQPGYKGPFFGEDELLFACEECLAGGALEDADVIANPNADVESLWEQLKTMHPDANQQEMAALVEHRIQELAERTPPLASNNFLLWPVHCGDFACYEREAGRADFVELAEDNDGQGYFAAHIRGERPDSGTDDLYSSLTPVKLTAPTNEKVRALLFRCLNCSQSIIILDADTEQ